jgi:hypothetical protein
VEKEGGRRNQNGGEGVVIGVYNYGFLGVQRFILSFKWFCVGGQAADILLCGFSYCFSRNFSSFSFRIFTYLHAFDEWQVSRWG